MVLQICLLIVTLQGPTFEGHAFQPGQTPDIIIGQAASLSIAAARNTVNGPGDLAFDQAGGLWVVDGSNNRVLEFTPPFRSNMNASLVIGQPDFLANNAYLYEVGGNIFGSPRAVAFDAKGNLWVTDYWKSRILEFEPPFMIGMNASKVIGEPNFFEEFWFHHPDVNAARNRMAGPSGLAFDRFGNLWVADVNYNRVLEFEPPFMNGMDASLVIGEPSFTTGLCPPYLPVQFSYACPEGDYGPARLRNPRAVMFDDSGNLWVTDTGSSAGGRILEFKPPFRNGMNASLVRDMIAGSLAFDQEGNLWVGASSWGLSTAGRVFEFHPPFNDRMNASLVMGSDYFGDPRSLVGNPILLNPLIMSPDALAFDSAGNLWVSDSLSALICVAVNCNPGFGRILGFDAQEHSVLGPTGRVYFRNNAGLMVPLSSVPVTQVGSMTFPEGMFNFTIQGMPAGGAVTVTITFPQALPIGIAWWSYSSGRWGQLAASQTRTDGNSITLTLMNASENGVISEFGGPAFSRTSMISSQSVTTMSSLRQETPLPNIALVVSLAVIILAAGIAIVLYRKRSQILKSDHKDYLSANNFVPALSHPNPANLIRLEGVRSKNVGGGDYHGTVTCLNCTGAYLRQ